MIRGFESGKIFSVFDFCFALYIVVFKYCKFSFGTNLFKRVCCAVMRDIRVKYFVEIILLLGGGAADGER